MMYLHGLFPEAFLGRDRRRARGHARDARVLEHVTATDGSFATPRSRRGLLEHLPRELGFKHVLSDLRFLEYPPGGHILTHVDGRQKGRRDERRQHELVPPLHGVRPAGRGRGRRSSSPRRTTTRRCCSGGGPVRGSVLVFPHGVPHRGQFVSSHAKVLLRGVIYISGGESDPGGARVAQWAFSHRVVSVP